MVEEQMLSSQKDQNVNNKNEESSKSNIKTDKSINTGDQVLNTQNQIPLNIPHQNIATSNNLESQNLNNSPVHTNLVQNV